MTSTQTIPQNAAVLKVELLISNLLRIGVITSLTIVVIGTVLTFVHHPEYLQSRDALADLISGKNAFPHTIGEVWTGLLMLHGRSIVIVGLLLLIATPVMRVGVSIFAFLYERDRIFALITTIVFLLLLLSFLLGKATA
ncbi:MAG TPA: DUF1634 domain-containing protein [Phycisphaerae bacterium]|nr:DUF1634 domain-containing protein [Phycisphaerae bacterium]